MAAFNIKRQYSRKKRFSLWIVFCVMLFLLSSSAVLSLFWYQNSLKPLSDSQQEILVTIQIGATTSEIGDLLVEKGLIKSDLSFDIYTRLNDSRGRLQAGGYKLSPSMSLSQITNKLVGGDVATDLFTILPAQRLDQIKAALAKAGYSQTEIDDALNPDNYPNHPALAGKPAASNLEGYLYPNSYQKSETTSALTIIEAALDEMALALASELLIKFSNAGLSPHEAITIASIVEREVSNPAERPVVAQVFLKRFKEGMSLGSDPTALYGALVFGIEPSVFADTPYNTRIYSGLPPGPINNVSKGSLFALANPADTDYLYFVSGDNGITYFSKTLQEHEALTAKHCIELCQSY